MIMGTAKYMNILMDLPIITILITQKPIAHNYYHFFFLKKNKSENTNFINIWRTYFNNISKIEKNFNIYN